MECIKKKEIEGIQSLRWLKTDGVLEHAQGVRELCILNMGMIFLVLIVGS
jgi:hypothetical protein